MPEEESVMRIFREILIRAKNTHTEGTRNEKGNRYTAWKSRRVIKALEEREQNQYGETAPIQNDSGVSVALSALYNARVVFSCRNCKHCRNCINAWVGNYKREPSFDLEIEYPFAGTNRFFDLDWRDQDGGEIIFPYATG